MKKMVDDEKEQEKPQAEQKPEASEKPPEEPKPPRGRFITEGFDPEQNEAKDNE